MIDKKYISLIEKLIEKTESKKANWYKTSAENEFLLSLEKSTITTDLWVNEEGEWADLNIRNDNGNIVTNLCVNRRTNPSEFALLSKLNSAAKESYYKIDETFNSILKELNSNDTIGSAPSPFDELPF